MDFIEAGHIYCRAARRALLAVDGQDRDTLVRIIKVTMRRFGIRLVAFCLMATHYHLLVMGPAEAVPKAMQVLNQLYATYFNRRHGGSGHVFEAPYGISWKHGWFEILATCRYIHLNALDALSEGQRLEDYPWSSLPAYLGLAPWEGIDPWLLTMLDPNLDRARTAFQKFTWEGIPAFREASRRKAAFPPSKGGRGRPATWQPDPLHLLAYYVEILKACLPSLPPNPPRALARCPSSMLILYCAHQAGLGSIRQIALVLGVRSSTGHGWAAKLSHAAERTDIRNWLEGWRNRALSSGLHPRARA